MNNRTPPPVLSRLINFQVGPTGWGRAFLGREHRPFICYGIQGVTFNLSRGISLRNGLTGTGLPQGPFSAFVSLVEWGTMDRRFDRVPYDVADPVASANVSGLAPAFPVFTTAPFLIDLAASFVDVPPFFAGSTKDLCIELALVPADRANMAAAGLSFPATSQPLNR